MRIPVFNSALAAAVRARLVLTIPGTKTIELAVLGKPAIAITPLNAPGVVTINGPLTYLDRIPFVGTPLKRAVAVGVSRRFRYHSQPNMDAGTTLIREVHGTVTPGRIARVALESYEDRAWLASAGGALARLYRDHVGASDRMAEALLDPSGVKAVEFSVVIATKDRVRYLERALASLQRQTGAPPFEVSSWTTVPSTRNGKRRRGIRAGRFAAVRYVAVPQAESRQGAKLRRRRGSRPVSSLLRR